MPRKNHTIEQLAKEYEGLTYKSEPYDFEALEEAGYTLVSVTNKPTNSDNQQTPPQDTKTENKKEKKWQRYSLCKRCAYKHVCNGPCAMVIDYVEEEKETDSEEKEVTER